MKNKFSKLVTGFLMAVLVAFSFGAVAESAFALSNSETLLVTGGTFVLYSLPFGKVTEAAFSIRTEVWVNTLAELLFPANEVISLGINDDQYVDNNTVHLPQSGAAPSVIENRIQIPAKITKKDDSDYSYDLIEFTSDPELVRDLDAQEVSYDKRAAVLRRHANSLTTAKADRILYNWAATSASNIVQTSGSTNRTATAKDYQGGTGTAATGNRKRMTVTDFMSCREILDAADVPQMNRFAVLPYELYNDLLLIDAVQDSRKSNQLPLLTGAIDMIFGVNIYVRSRVNRFTEAGTPVIKDLGAASAATDNVGGFITHPDFVRRALGTVKVFANEGEATAFGDVFSTLCRANGKSVYSDGKGIAQIVQDNS